MAWELTFILGHNFSSFSHTFVVYITQTRARILIILEVRNLRSRSLWSDIQIKRSIYYDKCIPDHNLSSFSPTILYHYRYITQGFAKSPIHFGGQRSLLHDGLKYIPDWSVLTNVHAHKLDYFLQLYKA